MAISDKTKARLWGRAALRCVICRQVLLIEAQPGVDVSLVGELCHIIARKPDGPRGRRGLSVEELNTYDNLILLCQAHHKQIDDHPESYPVEKLKQLKLEHECWVETELSKLRPWNSNVSQFTYLNIPRLSILAAMHGYKVVLPLKEGQSLHSLGWELNHVLLAFSELLKKIHPLARELPDLSSPEDNLIGITFSFNDRFRTKNVPYPDRSQTYADFITGDIERDPHIYKKFEEWKLVLTINPRWITTSTAYSEFIPSGGHNIYAGLCMIKSLDRNSMIINATPLLIGLPKSEFYELLKANLANVRA